MTAFITGSHAYGTPTADSDVDLVVLMDGQEAYKLAELSDIPVGDNYYPLTRFGKLNVISIDNKEDFDKWFRGTQQLIAEAPVTRDRAIQVLRSVGLH